MKGLIFCFELFYCLCILSRRVLIFIISEVDCVILGGEIILSLGQPALKNIDLLK